MSNLFYIQQHPLVFHLHLCIPKNYKNSIPTKKLKILQLNWKHLTHSLTIILLSKKKKTSSLNTVACTWKYVYMYKFFNYLIKILLVVVWKPLLFYFLGVHFHRRRVYWCVWGVSNAVLLNSGHGGYGWWGFGFPQWPILWRMATSRHHTRICRCHMSAYMLDFWFSAMVCHR